MFDFASSFLLLPNAANQPRGFLRRLPGRSTGYPALPPQTRTWRFPSYGSSAQILFTESSTRQATPRLAYNFAALWFSDIIYCVLFLVLEKGNLFEDHQIVLFLCGFFGLTIDATLFPHIRIQLQVLWNYFLHHSTDKIHAVYYKVLRIALLSGQIRGVNSTFDPY